jgi:hypothetical protein
MQTPKFSVLKFKQKQRQQKEREKTTVKPTPISPIGEEDRTPFKHCINVLRCQGFFWEFSGQW